MTCTLLSCVGMRDPYDAKSPRYYGALLASALALRPERAVIITTLGTADRGQQVKELMSRLVPECKTEIIASGMSDPSDFTQVDKSIRRLLKGRFKENEELRVNLSSGTPQMTICLSVLIATEFISGYGIRVADPQYVSKEASSANNEENSAATDSTGLSESIDSIKARVKEIQKKSFPVVEHVIRSNALKLCERYDYTGARELLKSSPKRKSYSKLVIKLMVVAEELFLLKVEQAREDFGQIELLLKDRYPEQVLRIKESLELHRVAILYAATLLKESTGRFDDFIRCAGLTREVCLDYHAKSEAIKKYFIAAVPDSEASPWWIDCDRLSECNPDLLNFLEEKPRKRQGSGVDTGNGDNRSIPAASALPERCKATAWLLNRLVQYAATKDPAIQELAEISKKTEDLAGLRNKFVHELRQPTQDDVDKAKCLFKKLEGALPAPDHEGIRKLNPFGACNEMLSDLLRFWQDD